jgi:hypothetical protein
MVLACLTIVIATVALWTHQVAFNTERFTAVVSDSLDAPEIIEPVSARISAQVIDALDVQARLEDRLPDAADPLAGPLTLALRDGLDTRLQALLAEPRLQQALTRTVSFAHQRVMNLLRDQSNAVSVVGGHVVVEVYPAVGAALQELQASGIIPADVQLPDLSTPQEPGAVAQVLETRLGVTLPEDFGTVQLMPADRLLRAQAAVRAFGIVVVVLIILAIALAALAIWLAGNRRRMAIYIALGTIILFLLARLTTKTLTDAVISGIADEGVAGAIRSVVEAALGDLRSWTLLILIATVIVGVTAYLWGRPARLESLTGRSGVTGTPTSARERRSVIERAGIAVIAVIVLWVALGPEVALIGAALVIGLELVLGALDSDHELAT